MFQRMAALRQRIQSLPLLGKGVLVVFVLALLYALNRLMNPIYDLPRNMRLPAFNPHRESFSCVHEADKLPPPDPQAQQWFEEALYLSRSNLYSYQVDWPRVIQLYEQAIARNHWKAMLNLAGIYSGQDGPSGEAGLKYLDSEKAVQLVERAMKLGAASAYDVMGTFHDKGIGVNQDTDRAYAFWQLAADMGSPAAQGYIGYKISGRYDDPPNIWGNEPIGMKMMECAVAQGDAKTAYNLGVRYSVIGERQKALQTLHNGVKFGSEDCARYLEGGMLDLELVSAVDPERSHRYTVFYNALSHNPDLRFPNLDKVLPLPPAPLPKWDGKDEDWLLEQAQGISPKPETPRLPGSSFNEKSPFYVPPGHALALAPGQTPRLLQAIEWPSAANGWQRGFTPAPASGYYQASLQAPEGFDPHGGSPHDRALKARLVQQPPSYYHKGEGLQARLAQAHFPYFSPLDENLHGYVVWRYLGEAVKVTPRPDPRVGRGQLRPGTIALSEGQRCGVNYPCPASGVWVAILKPDHPRAVERPWQAYVPAGQLMPPPADLGLGHAQADEVIEHWVLVEADTSDGGV